MDSKMKPLWLMYKNKWVQSDTVGLIFKNGDGKGSTHRLTTSLYKTLPRLRL